MRLHFESYGEGHPLVILHGLFGSLENWRTVGKELSRHFRVYALDLRNHGKSGHDAEFGFPEMAADVAGFLQEHALQRIFLLGHSMGGKVAMQLSVTWPDLVEKLVVVDMAPREYAPQHREILDALLALHPERFRERKEADEALSAAIPHAGTRLFLLKNLVVDDAGRFAWRINLDAISRRYDELLKGLPSGSAYRGPTLFIRGEHSNYLAEDDFPLVSAFFPAARMVAVPNAGHWVHADNPASFLNSVISFLEEK